MRPSLKIHGIVWMSTNYVVLTICGALLIDALLNCLSSTTHLQDIERGKLIVHLDLKHNTVNSSARIIEFVMFVFVDFHTLIILFQ